MPNILFDDGDFLINQKPDGTYDVWERMNDRVFLRGTFHDMNKAFAWVGKQGSIGGQAYYDYLTGKEK